MFKRTKNKEIVTGCEETIMDRVNLVCFSIFNILFSLVWKLVPCFIYTAIFRYLCGNLSIVAPSLLLVWSIGIIISVSKTTLNFYLSTEMLYAFDGKFGIKATYANENIFKVISYFIVNFIVGPIFIFISCSEIYRIYGVGIESPSLLFCLLGILGTNFILRAFLTNDSNSKEKKEKIKEKYKELEKKHIIEAMTKYLAKMEITLNNGYVAVLESIVNFNFTYNDIEYHYIKYSVINGKCYVFCGSNYRYNSCGPLIVKAQNLKELKDTLKELGFPEV